MNGMKMSQFEAEIETWDEHLIPADNSLYDHVIFDSDVEKQFAKDLESLDEVKFYLKLAFLLHGSNSYRRI